jgi:type IV pilus assembly protein PilB
MSAGKKVGELLVEMGVITPQQLESALETQRTTREFLGAVLVSQGVVAEEELLRALAGQFGMPFVRFETETVDWEAAARLATASLLERRCFPLRMDGGEVTAAISNPLDAETISEMEKRLGPRKVRWVLMPEGDVAKAVQELRRRAG